MSWDVEGPAWSDVGAWIRAVGCYQVLPGPANDGLIEGIPLVVAYRCTSVEECRTIHSVGLALTVETAALVMATIAGYATQTGNAAALSAAIDQVNATVRDALRKTGGGA